MNIQPCNEMSRRDLLKAGAIASVGLTGFSTVLAAEDGHDPFGGFLLGAQSYSFRNFDTDQALKRTHELGLHCIEFFKKHVPPDSKPEQVKAILKLCRDHEVTAIAYGVQPFSRNHDANRKTFELGKALGIRTLSADPDPNSFDSLDRLVEEYKISIGIHNHGPVAGGKLDRWYSAEVIMQAVKSHHPLIGSCLDTGHLIRSAQLGKQLDPAEQIHLMGPRNFGLHLKDHDNKKNTDVVLGKGALNVASVLKALRSANFKGYLSLEYEARPEDPSPDMQASVQVFKEVVKTLS